MERILRFLWFWSQRNAHVQKACSLAYSFMSLNHRRVIGENNHIQYAGAFLKNTHILVKGNNNCIRIGRGARLFNARINVLGFGNRLLVGDCCNIKSGFLGLEDSGCQILIGDHTTIEGASIKATECKTISIGKDCMLGNSIEIRTGDSHSIIDAASGTRINIAEHVYIDDHVWIGAHVKILKGANIGEHSVIGTGAIVTNAVPANSIAVGSPARAVRGGITWKREKI